MTVYLQRYYNSTGASRQSIHLTPPLRLGWIRPAKGPSVLANEQRVVFSSDAGATCADRDGKDLWTREGLTAVAIVDGQVLCAKDNDASGKREVHRIDVESGETRAETVNDVFPRLALETIGNYVGTRDMWTVALADLNSLELIWATDVPRDDPLNSDFAYDDGLIYAARKNSLAAYRLKDGSEAWLAPLGDLGGCAGPFHCAPMVSEGLVVCSARRATVGLSAETGERVWVWPNKGYRVVQGELVCIASQRGLHFLNLSDGKVLIEKSSAELTSQDGMSRGAKLATWPVVSECCVFVGDERGTLWAFDRASFEPIWHHRPEDSAGFLANVVVPAGERLYVTSSLMSKPVNLYVYEQDA